MSKHILPLLQWVNNHNVALVEVQSNATSKSLTYHELYQSVQEKAEWLALAKVQSVALLLDNSIDWVIFDLACLHAQILCTPLPTYFSKEQRQHVINQSHVDCLITNEPDDSTDTRPIFDGLYATFIEQANPPKVPNNTQKITFTSGSTGQPKGVCLSVENQLKVARSIQSEIGLSTPTFLSILPLPTLLENVAGVYGTLLAGGQVILSGASIRGFQGSQLSSPQTLLTLISQNQPDVINLVPELLLVLIGACKKGWQPPASLKFIAVGGSRVDANLLHAAHRCKLPVYQGYGLSECASVVSLNTPTHHNINSAGKPLAHLQVSLEEREIVVCGNAFLGYINQPTTWYPNKIYTGDLGYWDGNSLVIEGRKKHLIINSFGRNIAPEWPESVLLATGMFKQAVVLGDAKPALCALLTPVNPNISHQDIQHTLNQSNTQLPDYAQIHYWLLLKEGLSVTSGLLTDNLRPKRQAIQAHFQQQIDALYPRSTTFHEDCIS